MLYRGTGGALPYQLFYALRSLFCRMWHSYSLLNTMHASKLRASLCDNLWAGIFLRTLGKPLIWNKSASTNASLSFTNAGSNDSWRLRHGAKPPIVPAIAQQHPICLLRFLQDLETSVDIGLLSKVRVTPLDLSKVIPRSLSHFLARTAKKWFWLFFSCPTFPMFDASPVPRPCLIRNILTSVEDLPLPRWFCLYSLYFTCLLLRRHRPVRFVLKDVRFRK